MQSTPRTLDSFSHSLWLDPATHEKQIYTLASPLLPQFFFPFFPS